MAEFGVPRTLVTPAGTIVFNDDTTASYFSLTGVDGADGGPLRTTSLDIPARDGSVVFDAYESAAVYVIEGLIVAASTTVRREMEDELRTKLKSLQRGNGTDKWTPTGTNVVPNPSFETNLTGWTLNDSVASATWTRSTITAQNGTYSSKLVNTAAGEADFIYAVITGLRPSTRYTISAYVNVTVFTSGAISNRGLEAYDSLDSGTAQTTTITATTGGWVRHSVTVTTTAAAGDHSIQVGLYAPQGTLYWDAVQVEEGTSAGTFTLEAPRQRTVRLQERLIVRGGYQKEFLFGLISSDPLAYSQTEQTSADLAVNGAAVTVTNGGDVATWPRLRIYGLVSQGATNLEIKNNTSGELIRFATGTTIADGDYYEIDTRNESVVLGSTGVSKLSQVNLTVSEFWGLAAGANAIQVTGTSPGANAKGRVYHRDAWAG